MGLFADKISLFKRFRDFIGADDRFYGKLLGSSLVGILSIVMLAALLLMVAVRDHQRGTSRDHSLEVLRIVTKAENDITTCRPTTAAIC